MPAAPSGTRTRSRARVSSTAKAAADTSVRPMRFAMIMPWPGIKNAEFEIIERIRIVAERQGHLCDVLSKDGKLLRRSTHPIGNADGEDYDFVISPHYDSFRYLDSFHYYTLWNPNTFIQENSDFNKCVSQILSCEALLTTGSETVEDFMASLPRKYETKVSDYPTFYASSPEFDFKTNINNKSVFFYTGINWEAITKKKGRYDDILKVLDRKKLIKIFGPEKFEGVKPWKGFKTYAGEVDFDGVSLIQELNACGVTLVIASEHHNKDNLLSNRVWEGLAARTIIVSNKHDKVHELLGENALYFDLYNKPEKQLVDILTWIRQNPEKATEIAEASYKIFLEHLSLDNQIRNLTGNHDRVVAAYRDKAMAKKTDERVAVIIHTPVYGYIKYYTTIARQLKKQTYKNFRVYISVDQDVKQDVVKIFDGLDVKFVPEYLFGEEGTGGGNENIKQKSGELLKRLLRDVEEDYCLMLRPGTSVMRDHINQLKRLLEDDADLEAAFPSRVCTRNELATVDNPNVLNLCRLGDERLPYVTSGLFRKRYLDALPLSLLNGLDWTEEILLLKDLELRSRQAEKPAWAGSAIPSIAVDKFDLNTYRPIFPDPRVSNFPHQMAIIDQYLATTYPYHHFARWDPINAVDIMQILRIRMGEAVSARSRLAFRILRWFYRRFVK